MLCHLSDPPGKGHLKASNQIAWEPVGVAKWDFTEEWSHVCVCVYICMCAHVDVCMCIHVIYKYACMCE